MVSEGTFGLQYSFALLDEQGGPAALKGGSRLISAWKKAVAAAPKNAKQLNAHYYIAQGHTKPRCLDVLEYCVGASFVSRLAAKPEPSNAIGR